MTAKRNVEPPVSEGAKLALIAGDVDATRVLAAWACSELLVADVAKETTAEHIAELIDGHPDEISIILRRVNATGCLRDGGVSQLADRLLQQIALGEVKRSK